MPELHPGPDVSLGQLEAQLRELGLAYNVGYFLTTVDGQWVLSVSDEDYQRWQDAHGDTGQKKSEESESDGDQNTDKNTDGDGDGEESTPDDTHTTAGKTTRHTTKTTKTTKTRGR